MRRFLVITLALSFGMPALAEEQAAVASGTLFMRCVREKGSVLVRPGEVIVVDGDVGAYPGVELTLPVGEARVLLMRDDSETVLHARKFVIKSGGTREVADLCQMQVLGYAGKHGDTPEPAKAQQPANAQPEVAKPSEKPEAPKNKWPMSRITYWSATAGLGAMAVALLVPGALTLVGAGIHALITYALWSNLDGAAASKGLAPESGYRSGLAQKRNGDFAAAGSGTVLAGLLMFTGVSLGIVAMVMVAWGTTR